MALGVDRRLFTHISASETVWFAWMGRSWGKEGIVGSKRGLRSAHWSSRVRVGVDESGEGGCSRARPGETRSSPMKAMFGLDVSSISTAQTTLG